MIAHLLLQYQQVNNSFGRNASDVDRQYFSALPSVNVNFSKFSIGYSRSMTLPNIGDMIPYSVVFSPLYSVTGNPGLKDTKRNNLNASYRIFNYQTGTSLYVNAGASFEENGIFRQRTLDVNLAETSSPINRNGRYNYNLSTNLTKALQKSNTFQLTSTTNANFFSSHDFFVLNYKNGYQNSYSAYLTQQFSLNWKDIIVAEPQYSILNTHTMYSGVNSTSQNYIMHNVNTHFVINWPKRMGLEGNYTYQYNPIVPDGFQKHSNILSLNLTRRFLNKDRGEIKLSCYDILNQSINLTRSINENSITDTQSQIIRRYFMLTLQFKFNKSTSKGSDKPAAPLIILPK